MQTSDLSLKAFTVRFFRFLCTAINPSNRGKTAFRYRFSVCLQRKTNKFMSRIRGHRKRVNSLLLKIRRFLCKLLLSDRFARDIKMQTQNKSGAFLIMHLFSVCLAFSVMVRRFFKNFAKLTSLCSSLCFWVRPSRLHILFQMEDHQTHLLQAS